MKQKLKEQILNVLREDEHPMMIPEISQRLDVAYDTAKAHLLHLAAMDQVRMRKIGRHWVFWNPEIERLKKNS